MYYNNIKGGETMGGKPKCTLEQVKEVAKTRGFVVLETEYINNSTPMLMKCSHGHEFKISFQNNIYIFQIRL